jgi:hypothetical protein
VERTFAWLSQFRRLRVRYDKRADIHEAFLSLGCALIAGNRCARHGEPLEADANRSPLSAGIASRGLGPLSGRPSTSVNATALGTTHLVSQNFTSWNCVVDWLRQLGTIRAAA